MVRGKLIDYKDQIIALYNKVENEPFYTRDVVDVFPAQRMQMLTGKGYLEPTGEYYIGDGRITHVRKYKQWKFTSKGISFVKSFQE